MSGFIYAIRALDKVKIGFTSGSPGERLRALQTGSPVRLQLAGWSEGSQDLERGIHAAFGEYREHGEWFRYQGAVVDFVERLKREGCEGVSRGSSDGGRELEEKGRVDGGDQKGSRQSRWKARNKEKMRERHREYMREWRRKH